MIRRRFDRSSMAYRLVINRRAGATRPAPHEKHASKYPRVCVGVASLRPRRRMFHKTRPSEARLKPPPAQRPAFRLGCLARRRRSADAQRTPSTYNTGP